jgi:hypothetical protein
MRKSLSHLVVAAIILGIVVLIPAASFATPVSGSFDIGGSSATVSALTLLFGCNPAIPNAPCPAPANYGNFAVTSATGADFTPYFGQGGYIHNLDQASQPLNTPFSLPDFIVFSGTAGNPVLPPDIALDLHFIFLGIDPQAQCALPPAPGQNCTPIVPALVSPSNPLGLSAFNLQNTQTGSTASFSVAGSARRISTGELSNFTGLFTAQFNVPFQDVLATFGTSGTVTNSYSSTFAVTIVPEPETAGLVLGGLLIVLGRIGVARFSRRTR